MPFSQFLGVDVRIPPDELIKLENLVRHFQEVEHAVEDRVGMALSAGAELALRTAKTKYLTVGPLHVDTGRLRASVTKRPAFGATKRGNTYTVQVGSPVWYGRAWELGFTRRGKYYPPRKWLYPAVQDNIDAIQEKLKEAIEEVYGGKS